MTSLSNTIYVCTIKNKGRTIHSACAVFFHPCVKKAWTMLFLLRFASSKIMTSLSTTIYFCLIINTGYNIHTAITGYFTPVRRKCKCYTTMNITDLKYKKILPGCEPHSWGTAWSVPVARHSWSSPPGQTWWSSCHTVSPATVSCPCLLLGTLLSASVGRL